jgi:hypothetical protein
VCVEQIIDITGRVQYNDAQYERSFVPLSTFTQYADADFCKLAGDLDINMFNEYLKTH